MTEEISKHAPRLLLWRFALLPMSLLLWAIAIWEMAPSLLGACSSPPTALSEGAQAAWVALFFIVACINAFFSKRAPLDALRQKHLKNAHRIFWSFIILEFICMTLLFAFDDFLALPSRTARAMAGMSEDAGTLFLYFLVPLFISELLLAFSCQLGKILARVKWSFPIARIGRLASFVALAGAVTFSIGLYSPRASGCGIQSMSALGAAGAATSPSPAVG